MLTSDGAGNFPRRFATSRKGWVRARLGGTSELSIPFSLKAVPDRVFYPFGQTPLEPPKKTAGP